MHSHWITHHVVSTEPLVVFDDQPISIEIPAPSHLTLSCRIGRSYHHYHIVILNYVAYNLRLIHQIMFHSVLC